MANFVSRENLAKVLGALQEQFTKKVDAKEGLQLSQESFTTDEKTKLSGVAEGANNYVHPEALVDTVAGTYTSVTIDKDGHVTGAKNLTTLDEYGITAVEAAKVTGVLAIENIPHGALERCVVVADEAARLALTTEQVQTGDTVKQADTGVMYFVVDDTQLATEAGYQVYNAGSAASVPWGGVTDKPETMKNPAALTLQVDGVEKAVYDGAEAMVVNITADDINVEAIPDEDIDSMLNGTYTEGGVVTEPEETA